MIPPEFARIEHLRNELREIRPDNKKDYIIGEALLFIAEALIGAMYDGWGTWSVKE
jgi:hypothetical protein